MSERRIKPVIDTADKQRTYKENMAKHKKAMAGEFYFEAILIDYAMLEDRFRSFLYYIGLLKNRGSYDADNKLVKTKIKSIVSEYKSRDESDSINVNSISGKIKIVRCTLLWAANAITPYNDDYLTALKNQYEGELDIGDLLDKLIVISEWCIYRNEVIHSLLNKNSDSLMDQLAKKAQEGMNLARYMDDQVKRLKKGNTIRRKLKLSNE